MRGDGGDVTTAKERTGGKSGVVVPFRRRERRGPAGPAPADTAALKARIGWQPDMDAARIVRLRSRIAAGECEVDARRTAEGLIRLNRRRI